MKKFWNWLSGKKTAIAAGYWGLAIPIVPMIWDQGVPDDVNKAVKIVGLVLTYFGLGHKVMKGVVKNPPQQ